MLSVLLASCVLVEEAPYLNTIQDLQLVGLVLEPPEVHPGEYLDVAAYVADPKEHGFELMIWTCLPVVEGCLEGQLGIGPRADTAVGFFNPYRTGFQVPPEAEDLLFTGLEVTVLTWALICKPGACPIIAEVESAPLWPDPVWDDLYARLADPQEEIRHLDFEQAQLSARRLLISLETERTDLNENPTWQLAAGTAGGILHANEGESWSFRVLDRQADGMHAYGFTTAGAITGRERVRSNLVDISWVTPDVLTTDRAQIWVVFEEEDEGNGSAVFTTDYFR